MPADTTHIPVEVFTHATAESLRLHFLLKHWIIFCWLCFVARQRCTQVSLQWDSLKMFLMQSGSVTSIRYLRRNVICIYRSNYWRRLWEIIWRCSHRIGNCCFNV